MIHDATAKELSTEEEFTQFLRRFEACEIPKPEWTHAAHIAMAVAYLCQMPTQDAIDAARSGIQRFNAHHGGSKTLYHESLTRFWVYICDAFLQESALPGVEGARALVVLYGKRSDLYREYYSYDALASADARSDWHPPDAKPLPAAWRRKDLLISTNPRLLHIDTMHQFLKDSYWSKGIPKHILQRAIRGSLNFGVYESGKQIGFARVVTDLATYGYLADVFILESHRGRGLSKWLTECIMSHPSLQGFRRWQLSTVDAHGLYEKVGFQVASHPDRLMEILVRDIYSCAKA